MGKERRKNLIIDSLYHIILLAAAALALFPLAWAVSTALKPQGEIFLRPPVWIPITPTLDNVYNVLFNSAIPGAMMNSLVTGLMTTLFALVVGGCAGYAFARFRFRGNRMLSLFMLTSQMLPLTVLMIPLFRLANETNLIDTRFGLSIAHLVICLPLVTWMSKGYFSTIPREIEEAATVDGCNALGILFRIMLPLMRPALAATGIYAFVSSWNEFALANVLTRSARSRTVPMALNDFSTFFRVAWGDTMAAAVIITIPVVLVFILIQRQFVEGLASGAVKG